VEAVKGDKPQDYKEALDVFRRMSLLSEDLLFDHAKELVRQVKVKMDQLMGPALTRSGEPKTVPDLDAFDPFSSLSA
jgi:hypothetical protein